jgi:Co/Zn/Cd efflux system component
MAANRDSKTMQSYHNQKGAENEDKDQSSQEEGTETITNEYVLNVAFWTFIGFLVLEAFFAIIAGSQSMLEDAEAMTVDAFTYLFNLCAERIKHRPYTEKELGMPPAVRAYRRELLRLYLELIPPLISVATLIAVTVFALKTSLVTLNQGEGLPEADVDVNLMMLFSFLNLILDIVNVTCFARAHQAFGLTSIHREKDPTNYSIRDARNLNEMENLLGGDSHSEPPSGDNEDSNGDLFVNLNMCSAWTVSTATSHKKCLHRNACLTLNFMLFIIHSQHVCADTLRSIAVLIAAIFAHFFQDYVSGAFCDSLAAIVVSIIILISLLPLLHGLYITARKIIALSTDPTRPIM